MVRCPSCSRENEPNFRFCLGCGSPLEPKADSPPARNDPEAPVRTPPPRRADEPASASAGTVEKARRCPRCEHLIAPGFAYCGNCGAFSAPVAAAAAALSSAPTPAASGRAPSPAASAPIVPPQTAAQALQHAWVHVSAVQRSRTPGQAAPPARTPPIPRMVAPKGPQAPAPVRAPAFVQPPRSADHEGCDAWLVQIRSDGREGCSLPIPAGGICTGRTVGGSIFEGDPFLSPLHATFWVDGQKRAFVRDENSLNGTYLRVRGEPCPVLHGDIFRVGQELLRFEELKQGPFQPDEQGIMKLGSPIEGAWGRLCVLLGPARVGDAFLLAGKTIRMGRERGEILFPEDGFVSGLHAELTSEGGRVLLRDLGSSNGTYLRLRGESRLQDGDFLLIGQQLFLLRVRQ